MKKIIRLTESDLHKIVSESINRIICEWFDYKPSKKEIADLHKPQYKKNSDMKFYYDPQFFIHQIQNNQNTAAILYQKGVEWAERLFPGNEEVKKAAEEVFNTIKKYRETDEYKIKHEKNLKRTRQRKEERLHPKEDHEYGGLFSHNMYTPFFDPDMGWH